MQRSAPRGPRGERGHPPAVPLGPRAAAAAQSPAVRTDPRDLHGAAVDLLVVGAGLRGCAIAREAALRGLSVVLVDARDVGSGATSAGFGLWAGAPPGRSANGPGALRERGRLLRAAPHLVRPVPVLLPIGAGDRSPFRTRLGLALASAFAGRSTLCRPRLLRPAAAAAAFPGLDVRGLRAVVEFFDAAVDGLRLALANALGAVAAGARLATRCEMTGHGARGAELVDAVAAARIAIRARHVVNAAGAGVDLLRRRCGLSGPDLARVQRECHLVLPPRPGETALVLGPPGQRPCSVVPRSSGTWCGPWSDPVGLLERLGERLEPAPVPGDALAVHERLVAAPLAAGSRGFVTERVDGADLHTVLGFGLADHRALAERLVATLSGGSGPSPARDLPLPGGDGPREVGDPLWWRLGSRRELLRGIDLPDGQPPLCPHRPFLPAELVLALRFEGAVTFADVLLRRLQHDAGPCLEPGCLRAAHAWFLRARRWPVDGELDQAVAGLRAELAASAGGPAPDSATGSGCAARS